jgi:hypothetical protein
MTTTERHFHRCGSRWWLNHPMKQSRLVLPVAALLAIIAEACGSSAGVATGDESATEPSGAAGAAGADAGSGGSSAGKSGESDGGGKAGAAQGGAAQGGAAQGGSGGRAQAGAGGQSSAGAAGQPVNPACVKPSGSDVLVQDYALPSGCSYASGHWAPISPSGQSRTITDEATFLQTFTCQGGAASGIDFSTQRLQLAVYQASSTATRTWVVETADTILLGLNSSPWCGGTSPPSYFNLVLVPAGPKSVVPVRCSSSCNFGAGGYPA